MDLFRLLAWKCAITLRDLGFWGCFTVLAIAGIGTWSGYSIGSHFGVSRGVEIGQAAERTRQADAVLKGVREAIEEKEAAEDETMDAFNRAGGDLERLCKADPACVDRHELRLD